jgi:3-isopropylmalate/(R)-2-methylmalate dehydratase large subunit
MSARTLFAKIWDDHKIRTIGDGVDLLHVDRHLIHDLVAGPVLQQLRQRGLSVAAPELSWATPDHSVTTRSRLGRDGGNDIARKLVTSMRTETERAGIRIFDLGSEQQGIVHVVGPEMGITLPGTLLLCGDSHTCTHGGLGALSFGIGMSEVGHVLATQTIRQRRPKTMRITIEGELSPMVTSKDVVLSIIGRLGTAAGQGFAVEYAGSAVRAMDIEARMTLCNLSIELGAKVGMVAPDDKTFAYVAGRPYAPRMGAELEAAIDYWRTLPSDAGAVFDVEHVIATDEIAPQVTWGTSPQDVIAVTGDIPDPESCRTDAARSGTRAALDYMGLTGGGKIAGTPIDWVFIGSCANGRISDLRLAASVVANRKVAANVTAIVVPGSQQVKRQAEAEGLDRIFRDAGFEWHDSGCALCVAANGLRVGAGERSVSTSNRNFVGRQGPRARTHLANPATAAAAAIAGTIVDPRDLVN